MSRHFHCQALRPLACCRLAVVAAVVLALTASAAVAQDAPAADAGATGTAEGRRAVGDEGRRVVAVVIEGNERVDASRILSRMRLREGATYSADAANEDFKRIYELGEFDSVAISPEPVEGGLRLRVTVVERLLLGEVRFVGNEHMDDDKLRDLAGVAAGGPIDRQRLFAATRTIEAEYRRKGYPFVEVELDREQLDASGDAVFRVNEGPRITVREIEFEGNRAIGDSQLKKEIETKPRLWPFRVGAFDEPQIDDDVDRLRTYYVEQGFLDVEASRRLEFEDGREKATVVFVIDEGPRYRVASVAMRGVERLSSAYLTENMRLAAGEPYTAEDLQADAEYVTEQYGRIGYIYASVGPRVEFTPEPGKVDIVFEVDEGRRVRVGGIEVTGNRVTRQKVILRELDLEPEETVDAKKLEDARQALLRTQLFSDVNIDMVPTVEPGVEDIVVSVEERETAVFIVGAGVSSNAGLIGNIRFEQKNFDWSRWPRGPDDPGAFRGAGQKLRVALQPGTERQEYTVGFTEPYFLDRAIRFDTSGSYFSRWRESYDESRLGGQFSFGKRIARDLYGRLGFRLESIDIDDVDIDAPTDVFDVEGSSVLSSVDVQVSRDMTDNVFVPTTGYKASVGVEQAGALGGDYTFTKFIVDGSRYWTVTEDALGRRSVLALHSRVGLAAGDPPIFERFYAGGQGSIRGFRYRGAGPFERDDPIGGDFLLLASGEYRFPLYGENFQGVVFLDTGTVEETVKLTTYRVATGFGVRFNVDMFGAPVPFALDFGFPLAKHDDDETQVFSFSIAWSF